MEILNNQPDLFLKSETIYLENSNAVITSEITSMIDAAKTAPAGVYVLKEIPMKDLLFLPSKNTCTLKRGSNIETIAHAAMDAFGRVYTIQYPETFDINGNRTKQNFKLVIFKE